MRRFYWGIGIFLLCAELVTYFFFQTPFNPDVSIPDTKSTEFSHAFLDSVLHRYNKEDFIAYNDLQTQQEILRKYIAYIKKHSPRNAPNLFKTIDDEKAYYIDAYNALALINVPNRHTI